MTVSALCSSYFNGFQELSHFRENDRSTNICALIKVVSYITLVFPALVALVYVGSLLCDRCCQRVENLSPEDGKAQHVVTSKIPSSFRRDLEEVSDGSDSDNVDESSEGSDVDDVEEGSEENDSDVDSEGNDSDSLLTQLVKQALDKDGSVQSQAVATTFMIIDAQIKNERQKK